MKNGSSLNFLPEDEKKNAQEALKNKQGSQNREIKLVVPKQAEKSSAKKEKLSFWERRKQKKQEKRREALRKKGETAIKEAKKTAKQVAEQPKAVKSKLFTEKPEAKLEKPKPKAKPMPKMKPAPKVEAKPMPKAEKPSDLPAIKPMAEKKPAPRMKAVEKPKAPKAKKAAPKKAKPETPLTFTEQPGQKMHQPEAGKPTEFGGPTVNLVPESARSTEGGQPWILAAISLLIIVAIWFVAAGITVTHVQNVKAQVSAKDEEAAKIKTLIQESDEAKQASQKLQKQFGAVKGLVENHVYWSPFFEGLEKNTIPDVYYARITVTQTGEVVLRAIAKSYAAAARQIRAFEKAPSFVDSVTVKEAVVELQPGSILPVEIVAFDISLDLEDSLLKPQEEVQE